MSYGPLKERVKAMRRAAVAFANDYGPLAEANQGDEGAAHQVATKLFNACKREGLHIEFIPKDEQSN